MTEISASAASARESARQSDGRFGTQSHGDPDSLTGPDHSGLLPAREPVTPDLESAARTHTRGVWDVSDAASETIEKSDGWTAKKVWVGGRPSCRARNHSVARSFDTETARARLDTLVGKPSSVLVITPSGSVSAIEGTPIRDTDGSIVLKSKGSSRSGFRIGPNLVPLDVEKGYNRQELLAARWRECARDTLVSDVDLEVLDSLPDDEHDSDGVVQQVYLMDHPGFDEETRTNGCLFMAVSRSGEGPDAAINGYLWTPGDSALHSEHGSIYAHQLKGWGGQVSDYDPGTLTMDDCFENAPYHHGEALRWVHGLDYVKDE